MRFGILGPLEVSDGGQRIRLGGRRHHEVLAMLLLDPGIPVSADRMVTEVWGDDAGPRALDSLYTHVSNLRRGLGRERIVHDAAGYRLVPAGGDEIDAVVFEALTGEARQLSGDDAVAAVERLETALAVWRGEPFEGLDDLEALAPAIARLGEHRTRAEVDRFELLLRSGATPEVDEVDDLCRRVPLDERPWGILMRTLYRSGRQVEALRAFRRVHDLFGEELGVEPSPWLMRIEEQILLHDPELSGTTAPAPRRLPTPLTSFVGRERERADLAEALRRHRLVTLTGPGGVGKTRLAVEVAAQLDTEFPDGVWLVDLATVVDDRGVGPAIAAAVGSSGAAGATATTAAVALGGRRCLMILDNCEHVLTAARDAAITLLTGASDLVVLATSRAALDAPGEHRLGLEGLAISGDDGSSADAATLFLDRARSIRPDLDADDDTLAAIDAVSRRLDGIPLALELAAARIDVLSTAEIADLLAHRQAILVDPSREREIHRSLEATVGWSYGLLDADRRREFALLGVFEGPFTIDAAAAVLDCDEPTAIEVLHRLVAASLVARATDHDQARGPTRYRLLDTLRGYARARLTEEKLRAPAVERHDHHYVSVARDLAGELLIRGRPDALRRIAGAEAELTAAWDRLLPADADEVLPLAWALGNHWLAHGGIAEGEQRIRELLELTAGTGGRWRMLALTVGSWIAARRGGRDDALAWADAALALAEAADEPLELIVTLNHAGQLRIDLGAPEEAIALFDRSLDELARLASGTLGPEADLDDGRAWARVGRAEAARWSDEPTEQVRDLLYEARRHFVAVDEPEGRIRVDRVLVTLPDLPIEERRRLVDEMTEVAAVTGRPVLRFEAARAMAAANWEDGDRRRALPTIRAAIRAAMATGALSEVGSGLLHAAVFVVDDDPERAARLLGAGRQFCSSTWAPHSPVGLDDAIDRARRTLGDQRVDDLTRIGSTMPPAEAVTLVLR